MTGASGIDARSQARLLGSVLFALAVAGCASTQTVKIECVPENVFVFVDGEQLEAGHTEVALRTDEPHKIYVKGEGYEPQLVVLEPQVDDEGRTRLAANEELCIEPVPIGLDRTLEIEVERDIEVEVPAEAQRPSAPGPLADDPDVASESP